MMHVRFRPVVAAAHVPHIVLAQGEHKTIGRSNDADVVIDEPVADPRRRVPGPRIDQLDQLRRRRYDRDMIKVLNLYEAKSRLSALVEEAAAGHEIVIAKAGVPKARLVPLKPRVRRHPGGSKGRIWIAPDFDAPLPDDILEAFEGKSDVPRGRKR